MKRILTLILTLVVLTLLSVTSYAYNGPALLTDGADLLTDDEEILLSEKLELLSDKHSIDIAVMTSDTLQGYYDAENAATELYEAMGYREDGVMLFISMEDRDWYVLTSGDCISSITYNEIGYVSDQFLSDLGNGYYYYAFEAFAEYGAEMYEDELYTDAYSDYEASEEEYSLVESLIFWFVVGLVIALIVTGTMKSKLKSVRFQTNANTYMKPGSMNVTETRDLFLYSTVTKTKKAESSSGGSSGGPRAHRSSSGRSYGGRGGKF